MYKVDPKRSLSEGVSELAFFCSIAQVALAPSICLRLEIQALFWLRPRALMKLGIAIAASMAMIATTIMISTSVKPPLRHKCDLMLLPFTRRRERKVKGGLIYIIRLRIVH